MTTKFFIAVFLVDSESLVLLLICFYDGSFLNNDMSTLQGSLKRDLQNAMDHLPGLRANCTAAIKSSVLGKQSLSFSRVKKKEAPF